MGIAKSRGTNGMCSSCGKFSTVHDHMGKTVCNICTIVRSNINQRISSVMNNVREFYDVANLLNSEEIANVVSIWADREIGKNQNYLTPKSSYTIEQIEEKIKKHLLTVNKIRRERDTLKLEVENLKLQLNPGRRAA